MANARVNIDVGYTVDKKSFNQLLENLDRVAAKAKQMTNDKNGDANLKKQFQEAGKAAEQLYSIMNRSWDGKLNQVNLTKLNTEFKKTNTTATDFYNKLAKGGKEGAESANNFARSILNANIQLKQSNQLLDKMAVTLKNTVRYGISSSIFNNFTNSVQRAYDFTKNLDTSLNDIRIVSDQSAEQMERFAVSANKAAQALGKTTLDYTKAATIYFQQGLATDEVEKRTEITLKAANVTGQSAQEVSEQLTAVWNGYRVTQEELELYVDKLAAVAAATAADLEELSTGMSKVAAAASIMGVDIDQLNAQMATIISVTKQAPESVGTALRTIYARIADIKAGLDDEVSLGNYSKKMARLGFTVLDASGNLKDMGDVIEEIGGKWDTLTREQQVNLAQTMAGTRQYNNLLTLFDNWDMYEDSLATSANSMGELQRQQDIYMESTEAHLEQLRAEAEELYITLFDQEAVRGFVDLLREGLDVLNNYVKGLGGGLGTLVGLGSQLANIFSGQIAAGINNTLKNFEISKQQDTDAALKDEMSKIHAVEGDHLSEKALEEELKYANKIKDVRDTLSQQQLQDLTMHQKKIGLLEEEVIKQGEIVHQYDKQLKTSNRNNKNIIDELASNNKDFNVNDLASVTNLLQQKQGYVENLHDQERDASEERLNDIHAEIDAENEYISFLEKRRDLLTNLGEAKGNVDALQAERDAHKGIADEELKQADRQKKIQTLVKGTSAAIMLATTATSAWNIITDEELSNWDKFKSVVGIVITQLPMLLSSYKALKTLIPTITSLINGETIATWAHNVALAVEKLLMGDVTALGVVAVVAIAALTAALIAGVVALIDYNSEQSRLQRELDAAKEKAEKASEAVKQLSEAYKTLKDEFKQYDDLKTTLSELTAGTEEWKDKVLELNEVVLALLDKYPQLLEYIHAGENGVLEISPEGIDEILNDQREKLQAAQIYKAQAQIGVEQAQAKVSAGEKKGDLQGFMLKRYSSAEDIIALSRALNDNKEAALHGSNEEIADILKKSGIDVNSYEVMARLDGLSLTEDDLINEIKNNSKELLQFNHSLDLYDKNIEGYTNTIATMIGSENPDYQESENKSLINKQITKSYNQRYEEQLKEIEEWSADELAGAYANAFGKEGDGYALNWLDRNINHGFYIGANKDEAYDSKMIHFQEAREALAAKYASEDTSDQDVTDLTRKVNNFIDNLDSMSIGLMAGADNSGLGTFLRQLSEGQDVTTLYDKQQLQDLIKTFNEYQRVLLDKSSWEREKFQDVFGPFSQMFLKGQMNNALVNAKSTEELDAYRKNEFIKQNDGSVNTSAVALQEGIQSGKIDQSNILGNENYQLLLQSLDSLKTAYPEVTAAALTLEKTWLVGTQEYQEALEQVQDKLYETRVAALSQTTKELNGEIEKLLKQDITIEAILEDNKLRSLLDDYLNAEYQIDVVIHTEAEDEFNSIMNAMKDMDEHAKMIGEDFVISAENIRELNNVFPGIINNMKDVGEGKVQLDRETAQSAMEAARAEIAADSEATLTKLHNQADLLRQKQAVYNSMADAALTLAQGETESEETATNARATLSDGLAKLEGLNNELLTKQEMENDKNVADSAKTNGEITANNWKSAYQTAAQSSYRFAVAAVQNNKAAAGEGKPTTGDFNVNYSGTSGKSSEATILEGTQSAIENTNTTSAQQWAELAAKYRQMADSTGRAANDIEGMIAQIGARNVELGYGLGNVGSKKGSSAKPGSKDPNKDELDRYQLVNVQLKEISKQLSALDKQKNKLLGGPLVDNLNKQIKLLNDQISVTERKLKIAQGEQLEVASKLAGYGVKFDSEGNISNYASVFKQQQANLNAVYAKFNSMDKAGQDAYQATVTAAKESWENFKNSVSKYDNLIGETIPQLQQDIQDAFDKQTEMYIEEFNAEIKVRLDMSEAMRDWNAFKAKVIDGVKDDDILGLATARLKDFYSYYNQAGTAEIQALTTRLEDQLEELRKQDESGSADWYRDNRVKAIEDLQEYYDKIRESLTAVVELEEEMQQKLLDMMDQAQEKFDEQIDTFENINKHLEHNIELINLLTDKDDYSALAEQYAAQTKNRQEELDFYTQQKDFWENYLSTLEEGSEEWENAKAKYNEAADAWAGALTTTIQSARAEFENNINLIFKTINNQLTNNKGLDYLNEEWTLLGENSELVLDNINRMQGLQELNKKYTDAINSTSNIKAQQKLAELRDSELDSLKSMDALSEKDLERAEKKLDIIKAQIALEDAQRNKSQMRLRRDSQGNYRYQFVADEDEINQAQQNLYSAYNELYNFDKARYTNTLNEAAKAWSDYQQKMAEAALINDPEKRAEKEALIKSQYDEKIGILHEQLQRTMQELNQSTFAELNALYGENEDNYVLMTEEQQAALSSFNDANQTAFDLVFDLYTQNTEQFHNMTDDQIDLIQNQMVPQWTSGYQALVDAITAEGGIEEVSNRMMDEMQTAIDNYNDSLSTTKVIAGDTFENIADAQNKIIQNTSDMLEGNGDLIDKYAELTEAVKGQYDGLKELMNQYKDAADAAKQAAEDAYEYIMKAKEAEAADYKNNTDNGPTTGNTGAYRDEVQEDIIKPQVKTVPTPPFDATIPKGTALYNANGWKYPNGTSADRAVSVQAESGGRYRVWGSTFNPHVVYVDKNAVQYDTGGYTGAWGNSGKMAMLHEKELVLNKKDTANMLDAIEILRGITDNIGADVLNKMAGMRAGGLNSAFGGNTLDQNVHIEATFPGVTSSIEIQDALNNLVNMAAQRAQVR